MCVVSTDTYILPFQGTLYVALGTPPQSELVNDPTLSGKRKCGVPCCHCCPCDPTPDKWLKMELPGDNPKTKCCCRCQSLRHTFNRNSPMSWGNWVEGSAALLPQTARSAPGKGDGSWSSILTFMDTFLNTLTQTWIYTGHLGRKFLHQEQWSLSKTALC